MAIDYAFFVLLERCEKSCYFGAPKNRKIGPRCGQEAVGSPRGLTGHRISIAVGNIPAPGLGRLGAMQICCHAELGVEYIFFLNFDVSIVVKFGDIILSVCLCGFVVDLACSKIGFKQLNAIVL